MGLIKTTTEITQFSKNTTQLKSDCLAIEITNQSDDVRNTETGESIGYRLIINNSRVLLPGQSWSNSQLFGYIDSTVYNVSFQAVPTTPPTANALGCVSRTF